VAAYASLDPVTSTVTPGAVAATVTLKVRNTTDQVEEYQLSAVGPLARWSRINPDRLRIYPGDAGTATIEIEVPRVADAFAGPTPLGIRVVPQVNSQLIDVAEATVTVTPFGELRAQLNPVTIRGRLSGFLRVDVENRGNTPLLVKLAGRDDEDVLRFDAGGLDQVRVSAGQVSRPLLRIRSVRRRLISRLERYPFAVTVSPVDEEAAAGALPVELRGTYVQRSLLSKWVVLLVLLLIVAVVLCYLAYIYMLLPRLQAQALALLPPAAVGAPPPQGQSGQQDLVVTITHENVALAAAADSHRNSVPAVHPADGGRNQVWHLLQVGNGAVAVVPDQATGAVLEQPDGGSQLGLSANRGQLSQGQIWQLQTVGESQVLIRNSATGDCLTDAGSGRAAQAVTCSNDRARQQVWQLTRP
jgi:hypothetical protein